MTAVLHKNEKGMNRTDGRRRARRTSTSDAQSAKLMIGLYNDDAACSDGERERPRVEAYDKVSSVR